MQTDTGRPDLASAVRRRLRGEIAAIRNRDAFLAKALDCPVGRDRPGEARFRPGAELKPGHGLEKILRYGWYEPEEWGVWSRGKNAGLRIPLADNIGFPRSLELCLSGFVAPPRSQSVTIAIRGRKLATLEFKATFVDVIKTVEIEARDVSLESFLDLEFQASDVASPVEIGTSSDPRKLSFAIKRLRIG